MKPTQIVNSTAPVKPRRVIYAGTLYRNRKFSLDRPLFGASPNVWDFNKNIDRKKYDRALEEWEKNRSRYYPTFTNERSMIRGTIAESIREVGIYPVEIVVERPDGKVERWLITNEHA